MVKQCVPLGKALDFSFGASFRQEGEPLQQLANRLFVYWYESLDCTTGGQFGNYVEPKKLTGWQNLSGSVIQPTLGAKAASIELVQDTRYSNLALAYWDDVFFKPVGTQSQQRQAECQPKRPVKRGANLLVNGDFRWDLSPWVMGWTSEWVGYEGGVYPGAIRVSASSTEGGFSQSAFSQCVNMGGAKQFVLRASFKNDGFSTQTGSARLRIAWSQYENCRGRGKIGESVEPTEKPGWQRLAIKNLKRPPDAASATIEAIQAVSGPGEFSAFWDDVSFVAVGK